MALSTRNRLMLASESKLRILCVIENLSLPASGLVTCLAGWRTLAVCRKLAKTVLVTVLRGMTASAAGLWLSLLKRHRMASDAVYRSMTP